MDEEAQKRNTDCVYFLASPLTCKKGNSCEFRHSEAARMNPRDCWYWIHKTCLNPNCSFRHPPLPALSQPQATTSFASTVPPVLTASLPAAAASKLKTPCYFFSQGHCSKGDKCPFLHPPLVPSITEEIPSTQPPRGEPVQASSKPVVVLKKYNAEVKEKMTNRVFERKSVGQNNDLPVPSKAIANPAHEVPQTAKLLERAKIQESSVTSNPPRHEKVAENRKPRMSKFSDTLQEYKEPAERLHDMRSPVEMPRQGQPGRKSQQQSQHVSQSRQVADRRYQNGSRSEDWWKNESPGLEGDGSDQSNQREDGEYSPCFETRGRAKGLGVSTSRVLKSSNSYGQEEPERVPDQFRESFYKQHREQQMHHVADYNGSTEHPRHPSFSSSTRGSLRDGQRIVSERCTNNVDLRDHLMKRQRDDIGHYPRRENLARRGHTDMIDTPQLNQRLRDSNPIQQEQKTRETYRRVDYRGAKRQCHDGAISPDGFTSRTLPIEEDCSNRQVTDYSRNEMKDRGRERYSSKVAPFSDARSHLSSKSEYAKDTAGFSGPKTLAQIKAEKMAETDEHGHEVKQSEANAKLAGARSAIAVKNRGSVASMSKYVRSHGDNISTCKRESVFDHKSAGSDDFEGPKPLSLLLKEKQKVESVNGAREDMVGQNKTEDLMDDLPKEVEDGEVRDEKDNQSHYTEAPLHEEVLSRLPLDPNLRRTETHIFQEPDMDHSEDVSRSDVDMGPIMSGEEDYEFDDDDADDFAKKLGGFFS